MTSGNMQIIISSYPGELSYMNTYLKQSIKELYVCDTHWYSNEKKFVNIGLSCIHLNRTSNEVLSDVRGGGNITADFNQIGRYSNSSLTMY